MKRLLFLLVTLIVTADCAKIPLLDEHDVPSAGVSLTVKEAKDYFEHEFSSLAVTKSKHSAQPPAWMSPGDFTPLWDKSVISARGNTASVDVPMLPTYRYKAVRSEFINGHAKAYAVDVYQKLLVAKKHYDDGQDDRIGHYILTLIPDRQYEARHKGDVADRFINSGDKGGFSGLAIYYSHGIPMRINKFSDGRQVGGISAFGIKDRTEFWSKVRTISSKLGHIEFMRSRILLTRSGESGWDYGSIDDYTDMGDGIYMDDTGDYYIDWDNDGDIDSFYIMPDEPVTPDDPDPWWTEEEEPDEWWPPEPEEEDDYNDDYWYPGDSSNPPDEQQPDKPTPERPKTLSEHYGTPGYYDERVNDFTQRHPQAQPEKIPSYYVGYGKTYCIKFQDVTREKLSEAGKIWVDKTTVALQVKLTDILQKNPDIELDHKLLEKKAFESHVDAYIESGLLSLPMSDKLEILLTVKFDDLVLKEEGRQQAITVMGEQIRYYFQHPETGIQDAKYLMNNFSEIMDKIQEYVRSAGPDTKGAYNPADEVFDLIFGQLIEYYEENVPGFSLPAGY